MDFGISARDLLHRGHCIRVPTATIGGVGTIYQYETDPAEVARLAALEPTFDKYRGTGDLTGLAADIKDKGGTARDLALLYGFSERDVNAALDAAGIPRFAVGTNYVPRDMLAMIHEGEAIVPKAYNPAANAGMVSGGQAEALLAALLEQAARLEVRLAAIEGHAQGTNRATNGNPISPVPVALVEDETV